MTEGETDGQTGGNGLAIVQRFALRAMRTRCKNRGGVTTRYDSFEHVQNSRGLSRSMPGGDHPRFVQNGDALTNMFRMYHSLSHSLKSWTKL